VKRNQRDSRFLFLGGRRLEREKNKNNIQKPYQTELRGNSSLSATSDTKAVRVGEQALLPLTRYSTHQREIASRSARKIRKRIIDTAHEEAVECVGKRKLENVVKIIRLSLSIRPRESTQGTEKS